MSRKAVIYVRTSSEQQAEKSSPDEQEADCRKLAEEHGLTVVNVYRDIERYRVKNKLVEPSGTRSDRPGLIAVLQDAAQGHFDVIIAWREDRLYRSMRAMLMVIETIQAHKITVMLARETFDAKMAPLKAWVAGMEIDGIKERMTMGVKGRLRNGKANAGQDRYGYRRNGEIIEVVEEEAQWVQQIFSWYIARTPLLEIRRRLIEAHAPQKGGPTPRRIQWSRNIIQQILGAAKEYALGQKTQSRGGEAFTIPVAPIIDMATYEAFLQVREANKNHPARHVKQNYLIGGLLYCSCNRKWGARCATQRRRNQDGQWEDREVQSGKYYCRQIHEEHVSPDCPRHIGSKKADNEAWEKVRKAIDNPEVLLAEARKFVDELRANAESLESEQKRIQGKLDALLLERQWVITEARTGSITRSDMDTQLAMLTSQEVSLKKELADVGQAINIQLLDDWEEQVREYLLDLQLGVASLNNRPRGPEDEQEIFEIRRQVVTTLVRRITIDRNREFHVEIGLDLLKILNNDNPQGSEGKNQDQIKPARIHPNGFERENKAQIKTAGIYPGWRYFSGAARILQHL